MTRSLSQDLRDRIVAALRSGMAVGVRVDYYDVSNMICRKLALTQPMHSQLWAIDGRGGSRWSSSVRDGSLNRLH